MCTGLVNKFKRPNVKVNGKTTGCAKSCMCEKIMITNNEGLLPDFHGMWMGLGVKAKFGNKGE